MSFSIRKIFAFAAAATLLSPPVAMASVFSYGGVVSAIPVTAPGSVIWPTVGEPASVTFSIDDSDPSAPLSDLFLTADDFASASVAADSGIFSAETSYSTYEGPYLSLASFHFSSYGASNLAFPGSAGFLTSGLNGITITFGTPFSALPTTVGELVAAISAPGTTGFFQTEYEIPGDGFYYVRTTFPAATVPLPAGGVLLLSGIAGLAALRRRRG